MKKTWSTVEILRHSRHDWLNKLQLIKGNLELNKIDRVKEIIQEIVALTQQEAKLTNLNIPTFAGSLMTYNWENHHFQIEFEILGDVRDLSPYDESLTKWIFSFFEMINQFVSIEGDNHLSISIDLSDRESRFFFDFSGIIKKVDQLKDWVDNNQENEFFKVIESNILQNEILVVFVLKELKS